VNRWQALVEIVRSFNDRGATTLAFAALCLFVLAPIIAGLVVAMKLGGDYLQLPFLTH
jgi:hypothetical protein